MHSSLSTFVALLSLTSASLASPSHFSHNVRGLSPHVNAAHGIEFLKARTLGSRGKGGPNRLNKRGESSSAGEAVLKCTSAKTFQLCDGDRCTDMGSVAAGTMCKDGAITWDTTGEASPEDSSSASSSIAEFVSSKIESVEASSSSSASAAEATIGVKLHAVQTGSSSLTTPGPAPTQASSSSSSDSGSTSSEDDEEWECEADDESDSSAPSSTYTTSSAPQTTSAAPQFAVKPKTTTTTQAPAATSAAPIVSASVSVGTGGGDWITGGKATFFYQEGGYGACGKKHLDSEKGVALQMARYGTSSNSNPDCGKTVIIKNNANGKTTEAQVWDACPGCANYNSLDLSVAAFDAIGDQATGVLDISWQWA
ncbi:hypothetical protein JCM16303_003155 [Sporobolomyces ruberrimus]